MKRAWIYRHPISNHARSRWSSITPTRPKSLSCWGGYLFLPAEYPELRQQLLKLLLVNMGLREAVRMAPKAAWRDALERVYGEE